MNHASEPSAFHRRSAPILVRLAAVPPWAFVVGLAVALLIGLFLPGWPGAVVLLLLAAFLAWLAALSWSRLGPLAALVRGATIVLVVWAAAQKVV